MTSIQNKNSNNMKIDNNNVNTDDLINKFAESVQKASQKEAMDRLAPYLEDPNWFKKQAEAIASGEIPTAIIHDIKAPIYPNSAAIRAAVASNASEVKLLPPKINTDINNSEEEVSPDSIATPIKDSDFID